MMDVKKIKFRKERVDEFTVRHWFDAGTKHLGPVYAEKHYTYNVYDADGKLLTFGKYVYLRTLKDVKEWIAGYDDREDARLAEEAKREAEAKARWEERLEMIKAENGYWTAEGTPEDLNVGDFVTIHESVLSKPNSVGDGFYDGVRDAVRAKVVHVAEVTDAEFDAAVTDLYSNFKKEWLKLEGEEEHKYGGGYIGGYTSDDPRLEGLDYDAVMTNPEMLKIFRETAYCLIHAISAPNRTTLFVNTEGYGYPRYIAKRA